MELKDIYDILDRFENSAMTKLELQFNGASIICEKDIHNKKSIPTNIVNNIDKSEECEQAITSETTNEETINASGMEVKAVVPGTFYRASSPDSEPFVQVGSKVKKGDVVGLIEAMKMMNEVTSPINGVVTKVVAQNEEIVGYEEVLLVIEER